MGKILGSEDIKRMRKDAEIGNANEVPATRTNGILMLISFGIGIIGGVTASILGATTVATVLAIQVFAVFGFCFFIGAMKSDIRTKISGFSFPLFMGIAAACLLIGFVALRIRKHDVITEEQYLLVKTILSKSIFIIGGFLQIVPTLYYRIMLKKRCIEPVSAVCDGHRLLQVRTEDSSYYIAAPIWKFYYGGEELEAVDNIYMDPKKLPKKDEECELLVDPDKPERLISRLGLPRFGAKLIIGLILLALSFVFG